MKRIHLVLANKMRLIIILFAIVLVEGAFFYFFFRNGYFIVCEADFIFRAPQNEFEFQGAMTLTMRRDNRGKIDLDGVVKSRSGEAHVNRDILFTYRQLDQTSFAIVDAQVVKGERDDASDVIIARNFFSLAMPTRRVFTLFRVNNGYLIGNTRAPTFMCVPR